jgi:hypothetical protein
LGARYGSLSDDGKSYTEKEFEYAHSKGIPVLAFLHESPKSLAVTKTDEDPKRAALLEAFRAKLQAGRLVEFWREASDLCIKVLIATANAANLKPGVGWVRGDQAVDPKVLQETERLRIENAELRQELTEPVSTEVLFVDKIILAAGLTAPTTSPVLLIATAKIPSARLRVVLEYSHFYRAIGSAGWTSPRQVQLADLRDLIRGQQVQLHVASCKQDGSEVWWGAEKESAGNLIQRSVKYRAQIRFIGRDDEEQAFRFCLLRTGMTEAPYIAEVFTEQDIDMKS